MTTYEIPDDDHLVGFGKYAGMPLGDVDENYLRQIWNYNDVWFDQAKKNDWPENWEEHSYDWKRFKVMLYIEDNLENLRT